MLYGIIVAEPEELEALKEIISETQIQNKKDKEFYLGKIQNTDCVAVLCGIGKVNAARTTQLLIDSYSPDVILNIGVAGGISDRLKIGSIVVGEKFVQHDFDLTAFGREKGEIPNGVGKYIFADRKLLNNIEGTISSYQKENGILVIKGIIASGDRFVTSPTEAAGINMEFGADCVEMEGASVAQVSMLNEVPFLVIRSISDAPNDNNKVDFDKFIQIASKNVANFVFKLLS